MPLGLVLPCRVAPNKACRIRKVDCIGQYEKEILDLQKKCKDLERKHATEKKRREEKEKDVEFLSPLQVKINTLSKENEVLKQKLSQVTAEKDVKVKELKEKKEQIKKELRVQDQLKEERLNFEKRTSEYLEEASMLFQCRDRLKTVEEQAEKLKAELKKWQKKAEEFEEKKNRVTMEKHTLIMKNNELSDLLLAKDFDSNKLAKEFKEKIVEIESETTKASKQCSSVQHLEKVLQLKTEQIAKLERERQKSFKKMTSQDNEIVRLRNALTETEHRLKIQMTNDDFLPQRETLNKELSEAKTVISQFKDTIKSLTKDTEEKDNEREKIQAELSKSQTRYFAVKNQLELVKQKQAEAQTAQAKQLACVEEERNVVKKRLGQILTDKEKVDKELTHYKKMVFQQEQKIKQLETENQLSSIQRQTIEGQKEEIDGLTKQIKDLCEEISLKPTTEFRKHVAEMEEKISQWLTNKLNAQRKMHTSSRTLVVDQRRRDRLLCKYKQLVTEKDKENKELRSMLNQEAALQNKDAIEKLHRCEWKNRELKKQLETTQRILSVYEAKNTSLVEENKHLTLEVSAKHTPLPPISTKAKSNCMAKSYEQSEVGRSTRFMCSIPQKTEKTFFHLPPLVGKTVALQNLSSRPLKLTNNSAKITQQMPKINQHTPIIK
ncbi:axoneme-associated protein mst101(2) [Oreochromis niloticus]|uniref:axoneme-associated protein mst101(2) n=1 Tax=Oreochromis niloticus TaxID=8128 RepID=UPI000DF2FA11|nr:axoneme-associated protein mst101(2) [Oreochromis niloticus]